jgi:cytochrome c oxidase assembly factor CtaG
MAQVWAIDVIAVAAHPFFTSFYTYARVRARRDKKSGKSMFWVGAEFGPREINSQSLRVSAALAN